MKKLLLSLLIGLLSCISFGYCDTGDLVKGSVVKSDRSTSDINIYSENLYENLQGSYNFFNYTNNNLVLCVISNGGSVNGAYAQGTFSISSSAGNHFCYYMPSSESSWYSYVNGSNFNVNVFYVSSPMSSSDCQSTYSLVPSSDLTTCQLELSQWQSDYNSCSSSLSSCQSDLSTATGYIDSLEGEISQCTQDLINCSNSSNTGSCETGSNWSALYINDIQHLGKPNIFITIPEEIDWDYTSEGDDFDLDIVGYNVDTEYIDGIIRTQNYKPTTEDFTKLVGLLAPYTKILVFLLFVFVIWAWIKKPFKSKKL